MNGSQMMRVTVFERLNIRDAVPVFGGKEFQLVVADLPLSR